ncbi:MAG TPA: hypothetical protein DCR97_12470 [Deltaproteobacteria bacterium]|jgi:hypothetical protein|nr:hypothetical protein [Deltaproteobacteria bacterium]
MEEIEFDKHLILSLFGAHIYDRENFENPKKLLRLKDNLEQTYYLTDLSRDQEYNLSVSVVADKDTRRETLITNNEFQCHKGFGEVNRKQCGVITKGRRVSKACRDSLLMTIRG